MEKNSRAEGKKGEKAAEKVLRKKGYKILERNYTARHGELDIVAYKKPYYVFVEVKSREATAFGLPREAVDERKIKRILYAAKEYMTVRKLNDVFVRFDVVEITDGKAEIIENAFGEIENRY